jgi:type IV fimbrial biogenesis protein FimT
MYLNMRTMSVDSRNPIRPYRGVAQNSRARGFTLIEIMVVVAIVAILAAIAAPSFKSQIQSSNMTSAVNNFLADMRFARSEAIRRGGSVVMCRSDAPEAAQPTCGSGSTLGWESGWIIFHDLNSNSQRTSTEPLLRAQAAITAINTISESGAATKFEFTATGRLKASGMTSIQFGSTPTFASAAQRTVCVSIGGRARIAGDGSFYPCT